MSKEERKDDYLWSLQSRLQLAMPSSSEALCAEAVQLQAVRTTAAALQLTVRPDDSISQGNVTSYIYKGLVVVGCINASKSESRHIFQHVPSST